MGVDSGGTLKVGTMPATGEGTRLMFYPKKAALRAGYAQGAQWDDTNIGQYSTAIGVNTTASGARSVALSKTPLAL